MPSKNSLKDLAAIAQINNALQAPSQEALQSQQRAQQADLATALQVLNLQQQQQQQATTNQFNTQKLAQDQTQFNTMQKSYGDRNFNDAAQMFGTPGANPVTNRAIAGRYPEFGAAQKGMEQENTQMLLQKFLPQIQALQGKPDALVAMQGAVPPEVWQLAMQQIQGNTARNSPPGHSMSPSRGHLMNQPQQAPAMFQSQPQPQQAGPPSGNLRVQDTGSAMGPEFDLSGMPTYGNYFGPQVAGTGDFSGYLADLFRYAFGGGVKGPQLVQPKQ